MGNEKNNFNDVINALLNASKSEFVAFKLKSIKYTKAGKEGVDIAFSFEPDPNYTIPEKEAEI